MQLGTLRNNIKKQELIRNKKNIGKFEFFKDNFCTYNGKPIVPYKLRSYQQKDLIDFKSMKQPKMYLIYPRRSGKDTWCFPVLLDYALEHSGNYAYILPDREQASKVIWRGMMIDRSNNEDNPEVVRFLDMIPKEVIIKKNDQEKIVTLVNGSVIYLSGATRPDSLRGINLRGIVFSEFGFYRSYEVYQVLQPVITQSKAWVLINTTPNDYNFSWRLFKTLQNDNRWITRIETVDTLLNDKGNRYITDKEIQECKIDGNMPDYMVKREFYCEPSLNSDCLYYAHEMKLIDDENRICDVQIKHNLPIHFAFDLGSDATPIIGFQVEISGTIRIVFYHKPTTEVYTYGWYYNLIKEYTLKNNAIMGKCILPHDSVKRQVGETTISTAKQSFKNAGADVIVLRRVGNKDALINLSKLYLSKVLITNKATHLIDSLSAYSRNYNEKDKLFDKKPKHDWASHASDCWQYVAQAIEEANLSIKKTIKSYKWGDR